MNVTIYSDASLCPETRIVGWAVWIKSDRGTTRAQGVLKAKLLDTTIAEAMAAINGIVIGLRQAAIAAGDIIVINTDNDAVMSVLEGVARRRCKPANLRKRGLNFKQLRAEVKEANLHIRTIADVYKDRRDGYNLDVRWTHVKGHRGTVDRRAAVNHSCDQRAKEAMTEARDLVLKRRRRKNRRRHREVKLPAKILV